MWHLRNNTLWTNGRPKRLNGRKQKKKINKINKELIFIGVLILVYFPFSVWRNSYASIESDMANLVLEGRDLLNGVFSDGIGI